MNMESKVILQKIRIKRMTHGIIIGIGSNFQPTENVRRAGALLTRLFHDCEWSPFVTTEPVGLHSDPFLNGLLRASTTLDEAEVSRLLKDMESRLGRTPTDKQDGKVVIDLDLMAFDGQRRHERNWLFPFQAQLLKALNDKPNNIIDII